MKKILVIFLILPFLVNCSGASNSGSSSTVNPLPDGSAAYAPVMSGTNVLPVQVSTGYVNEPVVSVIVCEPGSTTNCVTINHVLLDTGSSGLRVFGSLVSSLNLTTVTNGSGQELAKCTYYGDGTTQWGPVKTANVVLGGETVSNVNIQIIDASYKTVPSACGTPESSPTAAQYNGILGVGIRDQDCGSGCTTTLANNLYFGCSTSTATCTNSLATLAQQVRNPVAAMTSASNTDNIADDNGSLLILPSVPSTGTISASGYLVFGIGTRPSNNTAAVGTTVFRTDSNGYFYTNFNGVNNIKAFIDSGSNGLYFPGSSVLPTCSGWFCPSSTTSLQATMKAYSSAISLAVNFEIINAQQVFVSNNQVYSNLGANSSSSFDWGLPFFFGRSIFTGINGKNSDLNGNGGYPFYAY